MSGDQSSLAASVSIVPLAREHFQQAQKLSDDQFGAGYFTIEALLSGVERSIPQGSSTPISSAALVDGRVVGFNIVVLPGTWDAETEGIPVCPELWPCPPSNAAATAYHVAVIVDPAFGGAGIGSRMFRAAASALASAGVRGIVAHVWKASASAVALSRRMRGTEVRVVPAAWADTPSYACPVCIGTGCRCDAVEVYYELPLLEDGHRGREGSMRD